MKNALILFCLFFSSLTMAGISSPPYSTLYTPITMTAVSAVAIGPIPASAKAFDLNLNLVAVSGNSAIQFRMSTVASGVIATTYVGVTGCVDGCGATQYTTGMTVNKGSVNGTGYSGLMELRLLDAATNTWVYTGSFSNNGGVASVYTTAGVIVLNAGNPLSSITIHSGSTANFISGSVSLKVY